MSSQLSADERGVRNAQKFVGEFEVLHKAGVGVIMVRTREPLRAIDVLRDFAQGRKKATAFWAWSIVDGWVKYASREDGGAGQPDGGWHL